MNKEELKKVIEKTWKNVLDEWVLESIKIIYSKDITTAAYDYSQKVVLVNMDFVSKFLDYLKDILRHEGGHAAILSNNLETLILQRLAVEEAMKELKMDPNKDLVSVLVNLFNDIFVNTKIVSYFPDSKIIELYEKSSERNELFDTMIALMRELTGMEYKEFPNTNWNALLKLLDLPWDERGSIVGVSYSFKDLVQDIKNFTKIMLTTMAWDEKSRKIDGEKILKQAKRIINNVRKEYNPKIDKETAFEIMKTIAMEGVLEEDTIVEWMKREYPEKLKEIEKKIKKMNVGILAGPPSETPSREFPSIEVVLKYYMKVLGYNIKVETIPIMGKGLEISGVKPWNLKAKNSKFLYSSFRGWFIPNITPQIFTYSKGNIKIGYQDFPNLLIVLDDSHSRKFEYEIGFHEGVVMDVVIAGVLARHYLLHNKKVGVVKFSSTTQFFGYHNDLISVLYYLASFEGEGTYLDIKITKEAAERGIINNTYPDLVLITDSFVFNDKESIEFINNYPGRAWVFIINSENEKWKKVKRLYSIKRLEDIIGIVLG